MMTPADVLARIAEIEAISGDYERAHSMEDDLYVDVLKAIAAGECQNPAAVADAALKSQALGFTRWCA